MDFMNDQDFALEFIQEWKDSQEQTYAIVSSPEYWEWLKAYLDTHDYIDDETAAYSCEGIDYEYGTLVSWFQSYLVEKLGYKPIYPEPNNDDPYFFETQLVRFERDGVEYECETIWGQGSATFISRADKVGAPKEDKE